MAYHDACHLAHGQRVRSQPRSLLAAVPGLELVPLAEADFCCGSAGVYNLLHPEVAREFLNRKLARLAETGVRMVIAGNPVSHSFTPPSNAAPSTSPWMSGGSLFVDGCISL